MLVVMSHVIGKTFDFGGECGVSFFFVLSGFILSYAYGKRIWEGQFRMWSFLKKQLLKFYPLHLLTFLVMLLLDARLGIFYTWPKLVANVLLLQSWVPSDDFYFVANGSSWFLSDLLFFYVVFGGLFQWLNRMSVRWLLLVMTIVLAAYVCLAVSIPAAMVNPILYASPMTRIIDFAVGILLARLYTTLPVGVGEWLSRQNSWSLSLLEMGLVLWVVASFFVYQHSLPGFRCASLFWGVSPLVILGFVLTDKYDGVITRVLHHPVMQWLGSISLEIYLTHYVTIRLFNSLAATIGGVEEEERLGLLPFVAVVLAILGVASVTKRFFVDKMSNVLMKYV
jgi:peptidoglycan/LPS O-acetylase OafA/YrhL